MLPMQTLLDASAGLPAVPTSTAAKISGIRRRWISGLRWGRELAAGARIEETGVTDYGRSSERYQPSAKARRAYSSACAAVGRGASRSCATAFLVLRIA